MKTHDLFSERMIIGLLTIVSFDALAGTAFFIIASPAPKDGAVLALVSSLAGALVAPIGQIIGSVFRTDRVDQQRAETASTMATALAAASPGTPAAGPTPGGPTPPDQTGTPNP